MQIMKLAKVFKNIWWNLTASSTINDLPDALIYISKTGNVKNFNKKARDMFNLGNNDELNIDNFITDGMKQLEISLKNKKPVLSTAFVLGRQFYIEMNCSEKMFGYCVSIRDLTKLTTEIMNDEKTQLFNNEKNAMLVKLEGDIKSPLTSISGFAKGLLDGLGGELSEKQAKYIKIIKTNADESYYFMEKLLEFSKAESSIYEAHYQNFDIIEALKSVTKEFEKVFTEKQLGFDINYDSIEKRNVYCDINAVKASYRNILETSLNMTETGFIYVKLSHPNEDTSFIQISLRDTGIGVAEDEMKYLCEPYAQLGKGKKNLLRALNLGTSSILIKRANGIIDIQSEVKNGTKFEIIFPIEKDQNE